MDSVTDCDTNLYSASDWNTYRINNNVVSKVMRKVYIPLVIGKRGDGTAKVSTLLDIDASVRTFDSRLKAGEGLLEAGRVEGTIKIIDLIIFE